MDNKILIENINTIIKKILEEKSKSVSHRKNALPMELLIKKIENLQYERRSFKNSIKRKQDRISIIGECKKSVPLKGIIRKNYDLENIANIYYNSGVVDAISVLTEEKFFLGDIYHLCRVRETVPLPVLRKDFIFDEYQIYESVYYGADAILLICLLLSNEELKRFYEIAKKLSLDVIFEVHTEQDIQKVLELQPEIIGINNRDLLTLRVDLRTTERLKGLIPKDVIVISESGIKSKEDFDFISNQNVDAVLIGTFFMEAADINQAIKSLI
ncbi:MAG: indole-3-glycerol phosphate synthase TrpC [Endomicrobia bacterium]|nr:indole-3-glycerol phosphate synthase TrpC [Endomicrobiia bacterium]